MALLLSGERPSTAAATLNPFRVAVTWYGKARAQRSQRLALKNLFSLDADRLDDLGINRTDLFDAMHEPRRASRLLTERRATHASDWLNP